MSTIIKCFLLVIFCILTVKVYGQEGKNESENPASIDTVKVEEEKEGEKAVSATDDKSKKDKKKERLKAIMNRVESDPKLQAEIQRKYMEVPSDHGKVLTSGMTVGWRKIVDRRKFDDPAISVTDSTLSFDRKSASSLIMSAALVAFPFSKERSLRVFNQIGFMANINLVGINNTSTSTLFNKEIEGGIGIVFGNNTEIPFSMGITYEKIYSRQLRDYIREYNGKKVPLGNNTFLTEFDTTNDAIYKDTYLNGLAISLIYNIGFNSEAQIRKIVKNVLEEQEVE